MRIVGEFTNKASVIEFQQTLKEYGILSVYDDFKDLSKKTHSAIYRIWIVEEDDFEKALDLYKKNQIHLSPEELSYKKQDATCFELPKPVKKISSLYITKMLVWICVILFIVDLFNRPDSSKSIGFLDQNIGLTPLQTKLLFDYPLYFEYLDPFLQRNSIHGTKDFEQLSPQAQQEFKLMSEIPTWNGLSQIILQNSLNSYEQLPPGTLFRKIREGEFWRLITPIFLHANFLHLFLNMSWLWILGRQIEIRIGKKQFLLLSCIIAVITNTIQYLMSGPIFLGYSGLITAMTAFIWMRQKVAPWEGYPLPSSVIVFLVFFIVAMCFLEVTSAFLEIFEKIEISPNIANASHISGVIMGCFLGRLNGFSQKI